VLNEWQANGGFEHFGNGGNTGDWNPTLWAVPVGIWGLIVGIMALRVHFERPTAEAAVDHEFRRLHPRFATSEISTHELRRYARSRLEAIGRLKFHVASWCWGWSC
jgi:hypothetical protein